MQMINMDNTVHPATSQTLKAAFQAQLKEKGDDAEKVDNMSDAEFLDIVFITDGKAPIAPKFLADFLDLKRRREFRVFGVPIQSHDVATLKEFNNEIIQVNELLDAEAEPLLEI